MDNGESDLVAVVQAGKLQSSLKITIPKRVAKEMDLEHGNFVGFYHVGNEITIRKMK